MKENQLDFWTGLRFLISRTEEFEGYCDWIDQKRYYLSSTSTIVEGKVGVLTSIDLEQLKFKLIVPFLTEDFPDLDKLDIEQFVIDLSLIHI